MQRCSRQGGTTLCPAEYRQSPLESVRLTQLPATRGPFARFFQRGRTSLTSSPGSQSPLRWLQPAEWSCGVRQLLKKRGTATSTVIVFNTTYHTATRCKRNCTFPAGPAAEIHLRRRTSCCTTSCASASKRTLTMSTGTRFVDCRVVAFLRLLNWWCRCPPGLTSEAPRQLRAVGLTWQEIVHLKRAHAAPTPFDTTRRRIRQNA